MYPGAGHVTSHVIVIFSNDNVWRWDENRWVKRELLLLSATNMALTPRDKYIIGGGLFLAGALWFGQSRGWLKVRTQLFYPPASTKSGNRIFLPVRDPSELHPYLIQKPPLLLNFVYRGETASNKLTGVLQRIVSLETEKSVNMVDIEADETANHQLLSTYMVTKIPTVVALKKQLPVSQYCDLELIDNKDKEVDWEELKKWVEEVAE
ncbi:hypothetical protein LJB42_004675 [Komagataella kurtzmanii]|nr:hypothetical protein LJB42_004675 [Komagataella kurtzmanii]